MSTFTVKVNDKNYKVERLTSPKTFMLQYAKTNKGVSRFFHSSPPLFNGKTFKITDLRDILKATKASNLQQVYDDEIKGRWMTLRKQEVGLLWIVANDLANKLPLKEGVFKDLKNFYPYANPKLLSDDLSAYIKGVDALKKRESDDLANMKEIESLFRVETEIGEKVSDFTLDATYIDVTLEEHGYNLLQIFDNFKTSTFIPFIKCNINGHIFTKINSEFPILEQWVDIEPPLNQIFFVFLQNKRFSLNSENHLRRIDQFYAKAVFTTKSTLSTELMLQESMTEEMVVTEILDQFEPPNSPAGSGESGSGKLSASSITQNSIKGKFDIEGVNIERNVFAYLINTNKVFKYLLLLDESRYLVDDKKRFFVVYQRELKNNITITISELEDGGVTVRMSRVENEEESRDFIAKFTVCCQIYMNEFQNVVDTYKKYCKAFKPEFDTPSAGEGGSGSRGGSGSAGGDRSRSGDNDGDEDVDGDGESTSGGGAKRGRKKKVEREKKTGQRLDKLKEHPIAGDMFKNSQYNKVCQGHKKQPRIVDREEAEEIEAEDPNKVMEFPLNSGIFYACEPIEPNVEKIKGKIIETYSSYPGLKKNKYSNIETYPFLPCCYPKIQKNKASSGYNVWYNEQMGAKVDKEMSKKTKENILNPQNSLGVDRKGELQFNIRTLLEYSGVKAENTLRLGVAESPKSLLHCMQTATIPFFTDMSVEEREESVEQVYSEMIAGPVQILKQSLYQYSTEEIREYLQSERYIDPFILIPLVEYHYSTNIFIFDDDTISVPKNKNGYIYSRKKYDSSVVIQAKSSAHKEEGEKQCEIMFRKTKGGGGSGSGSGGGEVTPKSFTFMSAEQLSYFDSYFKQRTNLYNVSGTKASGRTSADEEIIDAIRGDSTKQLIDNSGKTRIFLVSTSLVGGAKASKILVFTPPTYPNEYEELDDIDVATLDKKYKTTPERAIEYIEQLSREHGGVKIKEQYVEDDVCRGFVTNIGIFVYCYGEPHKDYKYSPDDYIPPYKMFGECGGGGKGEKRGKKCGGGGGSSGGRSLYQDMKKKRNIADILKNYTLKLYSAHGDDFKMTIRKNVNYGDLDIFYDNINEETNFYKPDTKELIVESKEVRKRLQMYLDVSRRYIPSLMEGGVVPTVSPDDFIQRTNQLIFTNDEILRSWITSVSSINYTKLIHNSLNLDPTVKSLYYVSMGGGKIMGLQNVEGGDKNRALYVSMMWSEQGTNVGYYVDDDAVIDAGVDEIKVVNVDGESMGEGYPVFVYPNTRNNKIDIKAGNGVDNDDSEESMYAAIIEF